MILGQLAAGDLARRLRGPGLSIRTGPFVMRVRSDLPAVQEAFALLYAQHVVEDEAAFADATLLLNRPRGLRRWIKPQVQVHFDGHALFEPLPLNQAYALLEWTMNWWIANHAHRYLLLHAAVVARDGRAVILPAPPGSGKSTLCAGLIQRGWRLLSDEMAMVSLADGQVHGMARPVSLKNASIEVIRRFASEAVFGRPAHDTAKGTVSHLRPHAEHVRRAAEPARARWVVFPRYVPEAPAVLSPRPKADAMMELGRNAFNYAVLGREGFDTLAEIVSHSDCFDFSYSRLEDAADAFERLAGESGDRG